MSFDGFLSMGGTELVNAARTMAYINSLAPDLPFVHTTDDWDTLQEALGDSPYTDPLADDAEWVSPDDTSTQDFYGLYPLSIEGISDSTLAAEVTQGILDGGFINAQRNATRAIRVHGILVAKNDLALEAGMTWLRNALADAGCGNHLDLCGSTDLRYFLAKPPADPDALYPYDRFFHSVKTTISAATIKDYDLDCDAVAREVDFTIVAENPRAYSTTLDVTGGLTAMVGNYVEALTNLTPQSSMETATAANVALWRNLVANTGYSGVTTGYTAIPGTGGTAALTAIGITITWSVSNSAVGGGISVDVAVTAGQVYSFGIDHVSVSAAKALQLSVEWRTASTSLSTSSGAVVDQAAVGVGGSKSYRLENVTAPATATIARLKILGAAGGVNVGTFAAGQFIVTGGWVAMNAGHLPPNVFLTSSSVANPIIPIGSGFYPLAGSPAVYAGDFSSGVQSFDGTVNLSPSTISYHPTWGMSGNLGTGATGGAALSTAGPGTLTAQSVQWPPTTFVGTRYTFTYWNLPPTDDADITILGGDTTSVDITQWAAITPGVIYRASIYVAPSKNQRLRLDVVKWDGATTFTTATGTAVAVVNGAGLNGYTRLDLTFTPAAGEIYALPVVVSTSGTGYTRWAAGDYIRADAMSLTPSSDLYPYFDGNTVDTTQWHYQWNGTIDKSPSMRLVQTSIPPSPLIDPSLPVLPVPPAPPTIPNLDLETEPYWLRYYLDLPATDVAEWAQTIPTVVLTTYTSALSEARVRFYANPDGLPDDQVDPLSYCGEFIISYLPANTIITVSGVGQVAYASVNGADVVPADQILYGTNGGPMVWPELSCGVAYFVTVDISPTSDIANLHLDVLTNRQE